MHSDFRSECVVVVDFDGDDSNAVTRLVTFARGIEPVHVMAVTARVGAASRSFIESGLPNRPENLSLRELGVRLGHGAASRLGYIQTTEPYVAFVTLDGALTPSIVTDAIRSLASAPHLDGIVWNRFGALSSKPGASFRRLRSGFCNQVARILFGLSIEDVHSPLITFRRTALSRLFERLRMYDYGFATDLLYLAKRHELAVEERPLHCAPSHRHPNFVIDAINAAFAIVVLRLYYSPIRNLSFVQSLGAHYVMPAKRAYSIAIFCWRDPFSPRAGGGEVYLYEQAKCWVREGCDVTWVSERFAGSKSDEIIDGIRFVRRGRGLAVFLRVPIWHIFESKRNYEFIIDVMNGIPFFTPLYSAKPKATLLFHVHSEHFHEELPRPLARIAAFVETKIVGFCYQRTRFMTISHSTQHKIRSLGISKLPILLIHAGVSTTLKPGAKAPKPMILYLGRLRKYKQVRKLLDAHVVLRKRFPDLETFVAGIGDDEKNLQEYVRELDIAGVIFTGKVSEARKRELMQKAWVFGMPSLREGWGIVVMEAAACGTPAVAYDVVGLRDCIKDGATGYLARTDNEFVERLDALLSDGDLRERLSKNALAWSHEFTWAATARRTLEAIRLAQPWRAVFEADDGIDDSVGWSVRWRQEHEARSVDRDYWVSQK